jgi:4-diphosphocytidyl-2-C-methyl-D-erythritol kinase
VNLSLDVRETRPDGFHSIESVMQTVSLCDVITLSVGGDPGIRISCDTPGVPTDERNLAWKAARLILDHFHTRPRLDIHIEKRIPSEAGLGGGSSDAAAVMLGLVKLLALPAGEGELLDLAAQVGSDVPFFIVGGTAFVCGRGEVVQPLPDIRPWWLVIVKPPFGVSTPWAYRRLDEIRESQPNLLRSETFSGRLRMYIQEEAGDQLPELLGNDLELPATEQHPEIAETKRALLDAGAKSALLCGSGSAVFGLFDSEETAREASSKLPSQGKVFMARTEKRALNHGDTEDTEGKANVQHPTSNFEL